MQLVPFGSFFHECCDLHDVQYGLCGFDKRLADQRMLKCMVEVISSRRDLDSPFTNVLRATAGYMMYSMVEMFGCLSWENSQKDACICTESSD
jgi:hypothetical protein